MIWGADFVTDRTLATAASKGRRAARVQRAGPHWYGPDFSAAAVDHLRGYLEATYRRYGLPIWVTEYSLIDFTGSPRYPVTTNWCGSFAALQR